MIQHRKTTEHNIINVQQLINDLLYQHLSIDPMDLNDQSYHYQSRIKKVLVDSNEERINNSPTSKNQKENMKTTSPNISYFTNHSEQT